MRRPPRPGRLASEAAPSPPHRAPPSSARAKLARAALVVALGASHLLWIATLWVNWGTPELGRRDWSAFRAAGRAVLRGHELYAPSAFPFLHPPPVAVLAAPVSPLGDAAFYAIVVLTCLGGLAAVAWSLRRLTGRADVATLAALASAPWLIGLTLGQPISVLVGAWLVGAALRPRRPFAAGLAWSVCALKPTFLLPLLLFAAVRREDRLLAGALLGACGLVVLALPVAPDAYGEWLAALAREQPLAALSWKQHTLYALFASVAPPALAKLGWAAAALSLGALALRAVRRAAPLEGLGILAIVAILLSPYAYFYDALLLVVALAAALAAPTGRRRSALLVSAAVTAVVQWVLFFLVQAGPPWAALPLLAWLAVALSAPSGSRTRPAAEATAR